MWNLKLTKSSVFSMARWAIIENLFMAVTSFQFVLGEELHTGVFGHSSCFFIFFERMLSLFQFNNYYVQSLILVLPSKAINCIRSKTLEKNWNFKWNLKQVCKSSLRKGNQRRFNGWLWFSFRVSELTIKNISKYFPADSIFFRFYLQFSNFPIIKSSSWEKHLSTMTLRVPLFWSLCFVFKARMFVYKHNV